MVLDAGELCHALRFLHRGAMPHSLVETKFSQKTTLLLLVIIICTWLWNSIKVCCKKGRWAWRGFLGKHLNVDLLCVALETLFNINPRTKSQTHCNLRNNIKVQSVFFKWFQMSVPWKENKWKRSKTLKKTQIQSWQWWRLEVKSRMTKLNRIWWI